MGAAKVKQEEYYYIGGLKQSLVAARTLKTPKCKTPFSIDCRERGSYARGVYLTHGNSKGEERQRSRHKNHSNRVV